MDYRNITDRGVKEPIELTPNIQNKVLKKNIDDLRRLGADIDKSNLNKRDTETDKVMQAYIKEIVAFLESYDFKRLEQRLSNLQWLAASSIVKDMIKKSNALGFNAITKQLNDINRDIRRKNDQGARQSLSLINKKRNSVLTKLGRNKI